MAGLHLIRFRKTKDHQRGLMVCLETGHQFVGLPGDSLGVTDEHIKALEQAKVPFQYLSKTGPNDKKPTPKAHSRRGEEVRMPSIHLIRFRNRKEHGRGMMALLE